jgi:hypothetical protein
MGWLIRRKLTKHIVKVARQAQMHNRKAAGESADYHPHHEGG